MLINFQIEKESFHKDFLYKKPYLFKDAINTEDFTWDDVNQIYSRGDISHRDFKIMNGYEIPKTEYIESYDNLGITEYRCITSILYNYLRNGATLVRNRIKDELIVDNIRRQIGSFSEAKTICGGYAAFSSRSSYKSHWDTRDVYAVQLLGKKRWILKKPNFEFPLYMQQTKNFPNIKEPEEIYMDVILEAGDILYIPRGWWHDPLPLNEETFHLAVATFPPTGFEYIKWLQNILPNILDCRKNLSNFEDDKELLSNISSQFAQIIESKKYYESFIEHHLGNHQIPSSLSLEVLGNGKTSKLNRFQKIILNSNSVQIFNDKYLIVNGSKLNIDAVSLQLVNYLFTNPNVSVGEVIDHFSSYPAEKLESLLFKLALENIIGLVK
jgi:50S ribosomal protein L16 3-hydroxylase